jgi:hypothetical protein
MLVDDARRYASKAQAAGSPVQLQTWPHMVHVWQIFTPQLPEAEAAFANIAEFIAAVEGTDASADGESAEPVEAATAERVAAPDAEPASEPGPQPTDAGTHEYADQPTATEGEHER